MMNFADDSFDYNLCIEKARNRDIKSQKVLYERCRKIAQPLIYIFRKTYQKLGIDVEIVDFLLNEAVLSVLTAFEEYYQNFPSYFFGKFRFALMSEVKKSTERKTRITLFTSGDLKDSDLVSTSDDVVEFFQENDLERMIKTSNTYCRPLNSLVIQYLLDGYEDGDIYILTGVSLKQIYTIKNRITNTLKREYKKSESREPRRNNKKTFTDQFKQ